MAWPTLISNRWVLWFLYPGLPSWGYWAAFLAPIVIVRLLGDRAAVTARDSIAFASLLMILWLLTATLIKLVTVPVYLIGPDAATIMRLSGSVPYRMTNGTNVQLLGHPLGAQRFWGSGVIINDSARSARLEEVLYSHFNYRMPGASGPSVVQIGPYSVLEAGETVDNFGPDDPPPQSVWVDKGEGGAARHWLTW